MQAAGISIFQVLQYVKERPVESVWDEGSEGRVAAYHKDEPWKVKYNLR